MSDGIVLYQKDILRHARSPLGYGNSGDADIVMLGDSPICGDHLTLYVKSAGDRLHSVTFDSEACCAVCRASSSMLTAVTSQMTVSEASKVVTKFLNMLESGEESDLASHLPEITVFSKIVQVPSRIECAALAWVTLGKCLTQLSEQSDGAATDRQTTYDSSGTRPVLAQ